MGQILPKLAPDAGPPSPFPIRNPPFPFRPNGVVLQPSDGGSEHVIVHFDVALCGGEVLMTRQSHDDLGGNPAVSQLGDEPPPARMAAGTVDAGQPVDMGE